MKNLFCRICRGRFNLKYPPAAVDSEKPSSRIIAVRIEENGEISKNICWDCEDTLLGFNKSVGGDNEDEEEPVVVDDDEILYKSLEKTRRIHRTSKEIEIIQIDSSDSEHEERVTVPKEDDTVRVESASTVVESRKTVLIKMDSKDDAVGKVSPSEMNGDCTLAKSTSFTRGKIVESMRCPLCPYLSGVEFEVVLHIRRTHPHYTGESLNFQEREGDSSLTRRIIFVNLWTFFECKECGKIHDRFWPHRKHLTAHDRKNSKHSQTDYPAVNSNKVFAPHDSMKTVQNSKRALDSLETNYDSKQPKFEERVLRRTSKDNNSVEIKEKVPADTSKKLRTTPKKHQRDSASKRSNSKGLIRKQKLLQAKREKRLQKHIKEKKSKSNRKPKAEIIPKPTFKMPQLPAPRATAVVKQISHHPKFTCKLCSQKFTTFIKWNLHMLRVHPALEFEKPITTDDTRNVCSKCDKNFSNAFNLRMHTRLSHRRKNRLVEINGNDDEEICRQTLTPKKESKEDAEDRPSLALLNGVSKELNPLTSTSSSALLCQYCGTLFASLVAMKMHETAHAVDADVKRIFKIKPQA